MVLTQSVWRQKLFWLTGSIPVDSKGRKKMQRLRMKTFLIPEVTNRQMPLRNGWHLFTNFWKHFFLGWGLALHVFSSRCCHEDKWVWMCSLLQQLYEADFFLAEISERILSRACVSSCPHRGTCRISAIKTSMALSFSLICLKGE